MKIFYSPVGDTDPIRDFRDGAMLHIARHYQPDLIVLFLSADMAKKQRERQIYTKALKSLPKQCPVEIIETDIIDVHLMENLGQLEKEFVQLRGLYPEAEFILNLSSGTPQMKNILFLLSTDYDNVEPVQVFTPQKGSNREAHAAQNSDDIDTLIEMNQDVDDDAPNRCHTPELMAIHRHRVKHQILSLVEEYEYRGALLIYKKRPKMFPDEVGKLLRHAVKRSKLLFKDAKLEYNEQRIEPAKNEDVMHLNEYLMLIELDQKKKQLAYMLMKLTPFLYRLLLFYLQKRGIYLNDYCCKISRTHWRIDLKKIAKNNPGLMEAMRNRYKTLTNGVDLSFSNMLVMLNYFVKNEDQDLLEILNELDRIMLYRNSVAHEIVNMDEQFFRTQTHMTSEDLLIKLRQAFKIVARDEHYIEKNVYDTINARLKVYLEKS